MYLCFHANKIIVSHKLFNIMKVKQIMANLEAKHPGESEYLQAVEEVLTSIEKVYNEHPEFEKAKIVERLVELGKR